MLGHRNLDSGGHTGFAKEEQFRGPGWQEFVEIKAAAWLNFYKDWLENNPLENILVLHYENIQQNLEYVVRNIDIMFTFIYEGFRCVKWQHFLVFKFIRDALIALSTFQQVGSSVITEIILVILFLSSRSL